MRNSSWHAARLQADAQTPRKSLIGFPSRWKSQGIIRPVACFADTPQTLIWASWIAWLVGYSWYGMALYVLSTIPALSRSGGG